MTNDRLVSINADLWATLQDAKVFFAGDERATTIAALEDGFARLPADSGTDIDRGLFSQGSRTRYVEFPPSFDPAIAQAAADLHIPEFRVVAIVLHIGLTAILKTRKVRPKQKILPPMAIVPVAKPAAPAPKVPSMSQGAKPTPVPAIQPPLPAAPKPVEPVTPVTEKPAEKPPVVPLALQQKLIAAARPTPPREAPAESKPSIPLHPGSYTHSYKCPCGAKFEIPHERYLQEGWSNLPGAKRLCLKCRRVREKVA